MKKLKVEQAVGQALCHDLTGVDEHGVKGVMFQRGHIVTASDIPTLLKIGKSHIFIWEADADEVHEDDAACALAEVIVGDNLTFNAKPSEGKITIKAEVDGLFVINRDALRAINSVDDYTAACIPSLTPVNKGQKVCGLRIVPLVTKQQNVDKAVGIAKENAPVLSVLPYKPLKTGVVITGSEVFLGRVEDRFEPVLTKKLARYGANMLGFTKCPDELDKIQDAIQAFIQKGAELILLTGGMSVDPDDLTPTAIRQTGADIVMQGVPVQPGNMLMLGYLGGTALVGVPGASMSSPTTSLDLFLPRIFAGQTASPDDIAGLGEGGLCMNCDVCRYPICYFGRGR